MPRVRAIQALLTAMTVLISWPTLALAHYRSGAGRWLERDPLATGTQELPASEISGSRRKSRDDS